MNPCGRGSTLESGAGTVPADGLPAVYPCKRKDTGKLIQAGLYWNWTQFQRFSGFIQQVANENAQQKEYEESKLVYLFTYTLAFPSVKRVTRFVDRFADTAFTKEAE